MRRTLVLSAAAAGLLLVPVPAFAYWSLGSTGAAGSAQAGTLGAPTISVGLNGGAARITVQQAPSTGPAPTGYRVDRTAPGATVSGVCAIAGSTGSCTDPAPVAGVVNTYRVVSLLGTSWSAIGSENIPSGSVTPPVVNAGFKLTAPATATAGTTFPVTITATATIGGIAGTDVSYTGAHTFVLGGAAAGPNGTAPTLPTTATFTNGVATVNVTLVAAGSTTLTVNDNGRTGTGSAVTVGAGTPAAATWTGVTAPAGAVTQKDATTYDVTGAGNNGAVSGSLTLADAFGNPVTNVGTGWTLTLAASSPNRPSDVGAFKVGTTTGQNKAPLTVGFPSTGAAALSFTYTHNGNPDFSDVITATAGNGTITAPALTINLSKT